MEIKLKSLVPENVYKYLTNTFPDRKVIHSYDTATFENIYEINPLTTEEETFLKLKYGN